MAINSGITASAVASYEQGLLDILARVRYADVELRSVENEENVCDILSEKKRQKLRKLKLL